MQAYFMAFLIGGLICVVGQLLMDLTPLTPAHVLVLFVVIGGVLSGMGLYQPLVDLAGAGATVPLPGFGHALVSGTIEDINKYGFWGIFSGSLRATASGIMAATTFGLFAALLFNPKG
ncbi:stage V sporulation protein AE [Sporolituus thermophilus]|uniref:Stage V sporulation protein AE n=1 Tax=Sporolituus thermophilus DSM 23256 TaxID=1123285 RepID=A0A1G7JLS8_9FIRM|nr:stage V sporulation protein AE [Sporolituus thermophilus DSM 23256]